MPSPSGTEMTPRERFRAVMSFQPFDRLPLFEWAVWWDETVARWHREGLPPGLTDRYDLTRHLGLDLHYQDWIPLRGPGCPAPASHGAPILSTMDDYERLRPHLFPWPVVERARWERWAAEQRRGEATLWFTLEGFFWLPRTLLGIEPHLYAFVDSPEIIHRINADLAAHTLRVIDEICGICAPDFMTFAEDLSYNHGPMLSKRMFDAFLRPYYDRVIPCLKERGIWAFADSDGDVSTAAGWFREAGFDGILPIERQAGGDVATLRKSYPGMRFVGCFDKMTMSRGEAAMRAEFERLLPTAATGGFVISCDHQTPPEVSLADYRLYLRLFGEYARRAGKNP